ncbi:alpha/beta fold hydrolase [Streptomyces kaempferi]
MTEFLNVDGGTIAYEVSGTAGPLVVVAHGMGDSREAYRFFTPALVEAGYRVAAVDLRGHGESSVGWASYTRTDLAGDLIALVKHLGGARYSSATPSRRRGHHRRGQGPGPGHRAGRTRALHPQAADPARRLSGGSYRRGATHLMGTTILGSTRQWAKYLDAAYPGPKPADWDTRMAQITAMLEEPGRMKVLQAMGKISPADAGEQLGNVTCPVLVVQGTLDPDWASPQAEGEAILADLRTGLGQLEMIEGAGHYPHVQFPQQTLTAVLAFLAGVRA